MYSSALNTYDNVLQSAQAGFNANIGDNLNNLFGGDTQITAIQFSKTSISNGQQIAYKYTKAGGNTAPGCTWSAISNVQSYAYVINHTNATSSYSHLLLKDIATSFTTIEDGILTVGTTLVNSFGVNGYTGPDASLTNQTYNFYVYGLSVATINSTEILQFYADLETYKVAVGSFSGYYSNTTTLLMI